MAARHAVRVLLLTFAGSLACPGQPARAHDIPNARVDRSTQVTLSPGRIRIDYTVSLSELTLTQELRRLIGHLPGAGRSDWFQAYGRETGPLDAKGFLVAVDGEERTLRFQSFDLEVIEHPRFTFHLEGDLPPSGTLVVHDTNYNSSEGTRRLGIQVAGVVVEGDDLPGDVTQIPERPVWQLSDAEEQRTRLVRVRFRSPAPGTSERAPIPSSLPKPEESAAAASGLSGLLERTQGWSLGLVLLLAFGFGALHALQPGHGKTLVVATVLGERGSVRRAGALAAITAATHTGSVLLVALILWWTSSLQFGAYHLALTHGAGFLLACVGFWRLGRYFGGFSTHAEHAAPSVSHGLFALGVAGGIIPCWDAIGLVVLGEAVGRLGVAVGLVLAFSLGLGVVLAGIGALAARFRARVDAGGPGVWPRRLELASGLVLSALGVYLLAMPVS